MVTDRRCVRVLRRSAGATAFDVAMTNLMNSDIYHDHLPEQLYEYINNSVRPSGSRCD